MSLRFILLAAASCLVAGCDAPTAPLDEHELSVAAQQVASLAGEAEWLAQQLRARRIPENMAWVHQRALGDDAVKVAGLLAKPVPDGLRPAHQALSLLDARLQVQVHRIASAAGHPDELDALQREFHGLAAQAQPLAQPS